MQGNASEIDKTISYINELVTNTTLEGYDTIAFADTILGGLLENYESADAF
jgi:hypothetical protein